jgi:hypothetical protein
VSSTDNIRVREQILSLLDMLEIKELPVDYARERLSELGVPSAMPSGLKAAIVALSLNPSYSASITDEEMDEISALEIIPSSVANDQLRLLGIDLPPKLVEEQLRQLGLKNLATDTLKNEPEGVPSQARAKLLSKTSIRRKKRRYLLGGVAIGLIAASAIFIVAYHLSSSIYRAGPDNSPSTLVLNRLRQQLLPKDTSSVLEQPRKDKSSIDQNTIVSPYGLRSTTLYVLSVGVSKFDSMGLSFTKRATTKAQEIADTLKSIRNVSIGEVQTRVLTDDKATKEAIKAGLQWLEGSVKAGDIGVVYFFGKLFTKPSGEYFYLASNTNTNNISETSVSAADITLAAKKSAGSLIFLFDTCPKDSGVGIMVKGNSHGQGSFGQIVLTSNITSTALAGGSAEAWSPVLSASAETPPRHDDAEQDVRYSNASAMPWDSFVIDHKERPLDRSHALASLSSENDGIRDCSFPVIR